VLNGRGDEHAEEATNLDLQNGHQALTLRHQLAMKQGKFWGRISVNQSAASRYESETNPMPIQVACMLHIAYGTPAQVRQLVEWLRRSKTD